MSRNDATTSEIDDGQIDQTLREIDEVAALADQATGSTAANPTDEGGASVQGGDGEEGGEPAADTEEARQAREAERQRRAEMLRERAKRQRDRGRRELERTFVGVVGLQAKVTLNDRALASHFERFAGLIDNTIYLLGRRGALVLGADKAETLLDKSNELVQVYADMAAEAVRATDALVVDRSAATLDWVVPTYQRSSLEMELHLKTRAGAKLLRAAHDWDKAIYNLSVLAWNDAAKESQIDEARRNERNALARAFNFALQIIGGLRRATQAPGTSSDESSRPARRRVRDEETGPEPAFEGEHALPEPAAAADYA